MADAPAPLASPAASALALYAKVLAASSLDAAAHVLVEALTADFGFTFAAIGLSSGNRMQLLASTHLDQSNPQADLPQALVGAMDEAVEQGVSLAWPKPGTAGTAGTAGMAEVAEVAAADAIHVEHAALQRLLGGAVASVALGTAGEVFAAVTVARQAGPFCGAELAHLEQLLVLAAPALRWMHHAGQPWHRRMARELGQGLSTLRQPRRRRARWVLAAGVLALFVSALAPLEYEVGGRARIEGAQQRVVSAPTDGFVKTAHVRPGDTVRAGDPLLDLIEGDLQLERSRWASQIEQHENAYAAAMSKADRMGASTSMARVGEAQAQLALVEEQITRGRITAPFDAVVIQGDLSQSAGAPVRQGDTLLTLASTAGFRVIVEIDETDIARVAPGQAGRMVLSSSPWDSQELVIERISPLSRAVDGRNVFDVQAQLSGAPPNLRPGLSGRAGFVVGRMPPLWAWSRHVLDRIRLAWWSWLG